MKMHWDGIKETKETIQRKMVEKRLQKAESSYNLLLKHCHDAVLTLSPATCILEANPMACRMLGYSREHLLSMKLIEVMLFDDFTPKNNNYDELLQGIPFLGEIILVKKDRGQIPVEMNTTVLPDGNYLGIFRDISHRKLVEEAGREREAAEERERIRTKFLQIAAHELRNPMAGVKGILSLIQRRLNSGKPLDNIRQLYQIMEQELDRLSFLLDEILEAFRVQEGQLILKQQRINLIEVINSALTPLMISEDKHRFIFEENMGGTVWVLGSSPRLEEVMRNLLTNAVKYSPLESEIVIRVSLKNNRALVSVQDYGCGIPKTQLTKIFDGFYRATNLIHHHDPGGLGLGLYICRDIIQHHNGRIWAESEAGKGAAFFIELPALSLSENDKQGSLFEREED
jgi:PAS domain S-box-containing protein